MLEEQFERPLLCHLLAIRIECARFHLLWTEPRPLPVRPMKQVLQDPLYHILAHCYLAVEVVRDLENEAFFKGLFSEFDGQHDPVIGVGLFGAELKEVDGGLLDKNPIPEINFVKLLQANNLFVFA